jgi:hypothetical protein
MKNLFSFIVVALLVGFTNVYGQQRTDSYDFPVKPGTDRWNSLKSYQEKRDVCKLPERILSAIPTKGLIETYVQYPLLGDIAVFRTWQEGVDKLKENFNGANELLHRADAGKLLLEYYKSMDTQKLNPDWSLTERGNYSFQLIAIEILLAQDNILAALNETSKKELLKISLEKLNSKKSNPEVYGSFSYTSTGWLMARILRNSNYQPFVSSFQPREHYKLFVEEGLAVDTSMLDDVIIHTQKFLLKH